jgi:hypothetical protein
MQYRFAFVLAALGLAACNNSIVVELSTGSQMFDVAASSLGLPTSLRDTSSGTALVASIDCSMGMCPSTMSVPIDCNADHLCDPAPISVSIPVGGVIDFDMLLQSAGTLLRLVDAIEIESVTYEIANPNTLTMALPATTVLWGPESATETSSSLQPMGTIPMIPAMAHPTGMMSIDQNGSAALGDYILHTPGRRVRFFARTSVDLNPGDPFPDGMANITVNVRVRAIGRIN